LCGTKTVLAIFKPEESGKREPAIFGAELGLAFLSPLRNRRSVVLIRFFVRGAGSKDQNGRKQDEGNRAKA
jgi:hypothetical protein